VAVIAPEVVKAMKRVVAEAALAQVRPGEVLGVGTGSTVDAFIDLLAASSVKPCAAVSSSERTSQRLQTCGFALLDANQVGELGVYVDGADEVDPAGCLIKGGGGALTREKILADLARTFICIVDATKCVERLGAFPLPIEVLPLAVAQISRRLRGLGAEVRCREGFRSDDGHPILDASGLSIHDPSALETAINQWPGVVSVGIFARRRPDLLLVAAADASVRSFRPWPSDTASHLGGAGGL
jgi:ribose 5-phosphate isomerase A